ncbi:Hypothetical_protein [Hexamita inflata]|uniref:Hypothetical_protein n=1 Tax=Hexamita inflata TaxID=28002 RepID=A0ABP1HEC0_9EUKA
MSSDIVSAVFDQKELTSKLQIANLNLYTTKFEQVLQSAKYLKLQLQKIRQVVSSVEKHNHYTLYKLKGELSQLNQQYDKLTNDVEIDELKAELSKKQELLSNLTLENKSLEQQHAEFRNSRQIELKDLQQQLSTLEADSYQQLQKRHNLATQIQSRNFDKIFGLKQQQSILARQLHTEEENVLRAEAECGFTTKCKVQTLVKLQNEAQRQAMDLIELKQLSNNSHVQSQLKQLSKLRIFFERLNNPDFKFEVKELCESRRASVINDELQIQEGILDKTNEKLGFVNQLVTEKLIKRDQIRAQREKQEALCTEIENKLLKYKNMPSEQNPQTLINIMKTQKMELTDLKIKEQRGPREEDEKLEQIHVKKFIQTQKVNESGKQEIKRRMNQTGNLPGMLTSQLIMLQRPHTGYK